MPGEERLSAVARRRRLNGNTTSITATTSSPSSQSQPTESTRQNDTDVATTSTVSRKRQRRTPDSAKPRVDNQEKNSFSALVDNHVVQFSDFREIERVSPDSIKIRLSKGQKCLISGLYCLWIKEGVIDLLGAKTGPSSDAHYVFATELFEVPAVSALSKSVEFEIHSVNESLPYWSGLRRFEWTSLDDDGVYEASFFVHGYSNCLRGVAPRGNKEVNTGFLSDVSSVIRGIRTTGHAEAAPTLLICQRQSSGTDMQILCTINRLITEKDEDHKERREARVLFLDLDPTLPMFSPPGMVSLSTIASPLFGPAFTRLGINSGVAADTTPCQVLQARWPATVTAQRARLSEREWITDCIKFRDEGYAGCPLVIRTGNCDSEVCIDHVTTIAREAALCSVICFGIETGIFNRLRQSLDPGHDQIHTIHIPAASGQDCSLNVQHQLSLQSYLHLREYSNGLISWVDTPLQLDRQHQTWLGWSESTGLISSISLCGLEFDPIDTADVLNGCIVAVVLEDPLPQNARAHATDLMTEQAHVKMHVDHLVVDCTFSNLPTADRQSTDGTSPPTGISAGRMHAMDQEMFECLGLGVVAGVQLDKKKVCLLTPIPWHVLEAHTKRGARIGLVVQRADNGGRFDASWLQAEVEIVLDEARKSKPVHQRQLSIGHSEGR